MSDGAALRVLSYNIHGQQDGPAALAEVVRAADPDVVIVQEGPRRLRWRTKSAQLAHAFGLVYATGGLPSLGNVILTSRLRQSPSLLGRSLIWRCSKQRLCDGQHRYSCARPLAYSGIERSMCSLR